MKKRYRQKYFYPTGSTTIGTSSVTTNVPPDDNQLLDNSIPGTMETPSVSPTITPTSDPTIYPITPIVPVIPDDSNTTSTRGTSGVRRTDSNSTDVPIYVYNSDTGKSTLVDSESVKEWKDPTKVIVTPDGSIPIPVIPVIPSPILGGGGGGGGSTDSSAKPIVKKTLLQKAIPFVVIGAIILLIYKYGKK